MPPLSLAHVHRRDPSWLSHRRTSTIFLSTTIKYIARERVESSRHAGVDIETWGLSSKRNENVQHLAVQRAFVELTFGRCFFLFRIWNFIFGRGGKFIVKTRKFEPLVVALTIFHVLWPTENFRFFSAIYWFYLSWKISSISLSFLFVFHNFHSFLCCFNIQRTQTTQLSYSRNDIKLSYFYRFILIFHTLLCCERVKGSFSSLNHWKNSILRLRQCHWPHFP